MTDSADRRLTVVMRCDALAATGIGHLVRQVALAEELASRGHQVIFRGNWDVPWAEALVLQHGWQYQPLPDASPAHVGGGADVVVLDGYDLPRALGLGLQGAGIAVMAMVDGEFGAHQAADLYVDQNLGASHPEAQGRWLVGPSYALLRDVVRDRRGERVAQPGAIPRALVVFGGSDPFGGAPVATELLLGTGEAVHAIVVAASDHARQRLEGLALGPDQSIEVVSRVDDLPALAITCDVAISAAGSTVWEMAALHVPSALIAVADNQLLGYRAATQALARGIGQLSQLVGSESARATAIAELRVLLTDEALRQRLATAAAQIIDGDGRIRVADALEELTH